MLVGAGRSVSAGVCDSQGCRKVKAQGVGRSGPFMRIGKGKCREKGGRLGRKNGGGRECICQRRHGSSREVKVRMKNCEAPGRLGKREDWAPGHRGEENWVHAAHLFVRGALRFYTCQAAACTASMPSPAAPSAAAAPPSAAATSHHSAAVPPLLPAHAAASQPTEGAWPAAALPPPPPRSASCRQWRLGVVGRGFTQEPAASSCQGQQHPPGRCIPAHLTMPPINTPPTHSHAPPTLLPTWQCRQSPGRCGGTPSWTGGRCRGGLQIGRWGHGSGLGGSKTGGGSGKQRPQHSRRQMS